jgi:CRISPR-associated protein Cas2
MRFLICYDIPSDAVRDKVAKWLDGYGDRIQDSVFEADLDADLADHMWTGLLRLVDAKTDEVALVPICAACGERRRWVGPGAPDKWSMPAWVVG